MIVDVGLPFWKVCYTLEYDSSLVLTSYLMFRALKRNLSNENLFRKAFNVVPEALLLLGSAEDNFTQRIDETNQEKVEFETSHDVATSVVKELRSKLDSLTNNCTSLRGRAGSNVSRTIDEDAYSNINYDFLEAKCYLSKKETLAELKNELQTIIDEAEQ